MVAVVARHAEKSELFSAGERAHPTNEGNLENSVCGTSSDIQPLPRDTRRFSSGHTEGLSRVRGCFVIRLAERPGLLGKPTHLRLHELSLNLKNLWKTLGLAQLVYVFSGSGDVFLGIGFHFFS